MSRIGTAPADGTRSRSPLLLGAAAVVVVTPSP